VPDEQIEAADGDAGETAAVLGADLGDDVAGFELDHGGDSARIGAMRGLVQRVRSASVTANVDGEWQPVGSIGPGLCVFVGVTHDDTADHARKLAEKLWHLRVMDDEGGVMNLSVASTTRELLVISQFTLYGDTSGGRRPSWIAAARPEHAEPLVAAVVAHLRALGATVATGRFRTEMHVSLVNDGPVTLMIEV
jgi:D-tyrosyl-tRNA(Tyr) deacylase